MKPQIFQIHSSLPPITMTAYQSTSTGEIMCDALDGQSGHVTGDSMTRWRDAVTKMLRARHGFSEPTRHIAVIAYSNGGGVYRLLFWPALRRTAMDGTVWWADLTHSQFANSADELEEHDWDWHGEWSTRQPYKWISGEHMHKAVVMGFAPVTWQTLVEVRASLDSAIESIAKLVTSPKLLEARALKRLGSGDGQA